MDNHEDGRKIIFETEKAEYPGAFDFPLLSDPEHKVIDTYGIYNPLEEELKSGIPYPTVYIINKEGMVVTRFLDDVNYERPTNEQIRVELFRLGFVKEALRSDF